MKRIAFAVLLGVMTISAAVAQETIGLPVGTQAPDFEALNYEGTKVRLSSFYKKGPVVLLFYRGGWCMYCNLQLQDYQQHLDKFEELGASIVAVSVDLQTYAKKTVEKKSLEFEVVSNPEADLLRTYNVIYQVPADLAKTYKEKYNIDLEAASGRDDHIIAVSATYVIDETGKIIYAYANKDYKVRKSAEEVLEVLQSR